MTFIFRLSVFLAAGMVVGALLFPASSGTEFVETGFKVAVFMYLVEKIAP